MVSVMTTATIRSEWVGRVVDERFTLLQWLGGSERSDVFLTELQGPSPRKAAIKLVPADGEDAEIRLADWATKNLSHPHLIKLLHTGRCQIDADALLYAVMEYADEVLSEIIPERPLTPGEAKQTLAPVLDALSYLHAKGFVHGHLKPSNIMAVDNQLKLSADTLHATGKPGKHLPPTVYDAPERANGTISPAADIWSLGVLLVETLTQHPPIWDSTTNREPVVPQSIPQPLAGIAKECLRSDLSRRCTISDVRRWLEDPLSLPNSTGEPAATPRPARLRLTIIIAAVLVLMAAVAGLELRSHQTRPSPASGQQQPMQPTAALPPPSAPQTQASKDLTVKGAVAQRVLPNAPQSALMTIQGTVQVRVRVTVDPSGKVSNATFDSPGPSKYFANLALQAARNWTFKPPLLVGQPVASMWILRFQFRRTGTDAIPVEASR